MSEIKPVTRLRRKLQARLEGAFGVKVMRLHRTHGLDDLFDIARTDVPITTIFDVGANTGQSADRFRATFPRARIYCFEPASALFRQLERSTTADPLTTCFNLALGDHVGMSSINLSIFPTTNSLLEINPAERVGTETVQLDTVDKLAERLHVDSLSLLKVDVEGYDLKVLQGARRVLSSRSVRFVLVEVGLHPGDRRHVLFDEIRDHLLEYGYRVFGLYDQQLEWSGDPLSLEFANACFYCPEPSQADPSPFAPLTTPI